MLTRQATDGCRRSTGAPLRTASQPVAWDRTKVEPRRTRLVCRVIKDGECMGTVGLKRLRRDRNDVGDAAGLPKPARQAVGDVEAGIWQRKKRYDALAAGLDLLAPVADSGLFFWQKPVYTPASAPIGSVACCGHQGPCWTTSRLVPSP